LLANTKVKILPVSLPADKKFTFTAINARFATGSLKMEFNIKELGPDGLELARELILFFQQDDGISYPVVPSDDYLRNLLSKDSFHILVALKDNALIGGATAYELDMYKKEVKEMFLYEIAVRPEYRGNGIGKALINGLKHICGKRNIDEMYVGTTTSNQAAIKLYSSAGGEQVPDITWFVYQIEK